MLRRIYDRHARPRERRVRRDERRAAEPCNRPGGGSNADDMGEDAPGLNGVLLAADLPEAMAARDPLMIALTAGAAAACTERCGAVPRIAGLFLRWREISPTLTAPETT